jgi:hypothetical protein
LWGLWALAWWLPEYATDPVLLAQGAHLGRWPVAGPTPYSFAYHAFAFTGVLAAAHWLLGRGGRRPGFRPSRIEAALVGGGLLFFFIGVLAAVPWAPLKLLPLLGAALGGLWLNRRREPPGSLLADPCGPARPAGLLALFIMPAAATAVYAAAAALAPPVEVIYAIAAVGLTLVPAVLGWAAFVVALAAAVRPRTTDHGRPQGSRGAGEQGRVY